MQSHLDCCSIIIIPFSTRNWQKSSVLHVCMLVCMYASENEIIQWESAVQILLFGIFAVHCMHSQGTLVFNQNSKMLALLDELAILN